MAGNSEWPGAGDPAGWVPAYRIVLFDGGRGISVTMIDAASDDEALVRATEIARGRAFELWDAAVRIGQYPPTQ